jgi:hypothetical protein
LPVQKILAEHTVRDQVKLSQASYQMPAPVELKVSKPVQLQPEGTGWIMPSLQGLSPRESLQILKGHQFQIEISGMGVITRQTPEAGKTINEGASVRLSLTEP